MKRPLVRLAACISLAAVTAVGFVAVPGAGAATQGGKMSTFLTVGPKAKPASAKAAPGYLLFTCQLGETPGFVCYDPYQMRNAYGTTSLINQGYDGTGKTIVIVDAFQAPAVRADLAAFDSWYGLPAPNFSIISPNGTVPFNPNDPVQYSWTQEITLDVEWAHAIAPGAKIVLDLAKTSDDSDILSATKYAVDNHLGDVISQSFGENESCVEPSTLAAEHQVFVQATRENITLVASSGDQGASQQTCDGNSWVQAVSSPASDPLVTSVGGTELHAADYCFAVLGCDPNSNPPAGTYLSETAWNEFDSESTGGGYSTLYNEPPYQKGTINGGNQRAVPDVAYNAAIYHGVLVFYDTPGIYQPGDSGTYLFGGTSCGSPQWSALVAIADQMAGHDLGFINTALYHIAQSPPKYGADFHDVTSGNNSVVETDSNGNPVSVSGFNAGPGWDPTTGLGSPVANNLIPQLIQTWSPGDATAVIAGTNPHGNGHQSNKPGKVHPH
ncbi:MAG TPA: S53 family peptidase [Chloroflexota bacterium]|nr:S53 family peptidase [Chloroflexota bacterium]